MSGFSNAVDRILLGYAALNLRAALEGCASPAIEQVDIEPCEDMRTMMIYAHLADDELTGGLPLAASFEGDGPDCTALDRSEWTRRFEAEWERSQSAILADITRALAIIPPNGAPRAARNKGRVDRGR